MLLALRSLFEPTAVIPPPSHTHGGGTGTFRGPRPDFIPWIPPAKPLSIPASVELESARATFRAGEVEATGGAITQINSATATFTVGTLTATGAANATFATAKSKSRTGNVGATGIENDETIAAAIWELL